MSSIQTQFLNLTSHNSKYDAIDYETHLKGSAIGKVVFISGASQGIGEATALAFAHAGAKAIYLTARNETALKSVKAKVKAINPVVECTYSVCDVTDAAQVEAAVEACVKSYGAIDILDANAGYLGKWDKIGESNISSWWTSFEVNIKGVYLVIRFAMPYLIQSAKKQFSTKSTGGHIILMSSIGAQLLIPGASDYQVSKHAINRLCEFVNVDHGKEGIKCFAIHPGGVATTLGKNMPEEMHAYLNDDPELAAGFIVWLCSGKADWASGRYLSSTWDVNELLAMKEEIIAEDLLVNRLRTKG